MVNLKSDYTPYRLVEFNRDGLVEQEHFGFLMKLGADKNFVKIGEDKNYPYFLRSCAKPLQASLLVDSDLINYFDMTSEEIAISCSSHAAEPCHLKEVKSLLKKIGLGEVNYRCAPHKPLSKKEQEKMIISGEVESVFHSNCSGKHTMMLALCKKQGWNLENYDDKNHPLQLAIKNKVNELCGVENDLYPITKDGCGVPILSMPLENMLKGYLNLFLDEKYAPIKEAFLKHPYLIGGENRLDTAVMTAGKNLIAKVGAGGICMVLNLDKKEALIIKIMDCDMKARAICLIEALRQLGWLSEGQMNHELIQEQFKTEIKTLHGENIGETEFLFELFR
jgi:L-asparaginase II